MYTMLRKTVDYLCVVAGCRHDFFARAERAFAHIIVLVCVANRLTVMVRCVEGIMREIRGV